MVHQSTLQQLHLHLSTLSVHLEHQAIATIVAAANSFQQRLQVLAADSPVSEGGSNVGATPHSDDTSQEMVGAQLTFGNGTGSFPTLRF